jgi:hypothetical protein
VQCDGSEHKGDRPIIKRGHPPRPGRKMGRGTGMRELLRTNDPVLLSWLVALLADADIEAVVLDRHTSLLEGSIGAIMQRLMVLEEDEVDARRVLREAGHAVP